MTHRRCICRLPAAARTLHRRNQCIHHCLISRVAPWSASRPRPVPLQKHPQAPRQSTDRAQGASAIPAKNVPSSELDAPPSTPSTAPACIPQGCLFSWPDAWLLNASVPAVHSAQHGGAVIAVARRGIKLRKPLVLLPDRAAAAPAIMRATRPFRSFPSSHHEIGRVGRAHPTAGSVRDPCARSSTGSPPVPG